MREVSLPDVHEIVELALGREVADLTLDTNLYTDLGMDSFGAVAMVVEIQRRFAVRIPDEDIPRLVTPAMVIEAVNRSLER